MITYKKTNNDIKKLISRKEIRMNKNYMIGVDEVSEELGVSRGHAYKVIRDLNEELSSKGFIVVAGKIPRAFWETKFYGYSKEMVAL